MTFRELSVRVLEPASMLLMILGIVALCQPWIEGTAPLWRDHHPGRPGWIFGVLQDPALAEGRPVMRLRMGMVGGGLDAMAGELHRRAAALDSRVEFVAGALSSTPARSHTAAKAWGLARGYGTWREMLEAEQKLPATERIEFVTVATPNHLHVPVSAAFAVGGFHVACDKPIGISLEEARSVCRVVEKSGIVFMLTHNYTGYPMVKQARHMIAGGELGDLLKVVVDYPQGWLLQPIEKQGHKGAAWRTDPSKSGAAGCLADIGSHAQHMMHTVTGLEIEELCADLGHLHGPQGRRRHQHSAALSRRGAGHAVGVPGHGGRGGWAEFSHLRHPRRARVETTGTGIAGFPATGSTRADVAPWRTVSV